MPTTSAGIRYPLGSASPNIQQFLQDIASDVNGLLVGSKYLWLQRTGTGTDSYSDTTAGLLSGTWNAAPQGAYILSATLAVQASANVAGSVIITAGGVTLTKSGTRADVPSSTAAPLTYTYPFTYGGGNLAVSMSHFVAPGGTVTVFNATTQLTVYYLGRTA